MRNIGVLLYAGNGRRGLQRKPFFVDDSLSLWIGKPFEAEAFCKELLAHLIAETLCLPGFRTLTPQVCVVGGSPWLVTPYLDRSRLYCVGHNKFTSLTTQERQIGVFYRLISNMDGNYCNLIKDSEDKLFVTDFEYAFHHREYAQVWRDARRTMRRANLYLREGMRSLDEFAEGIVRVQELADAELSEEMLFSRARLSGFNEERLRYHAAQIHRTAAGIEHEMNRLVASWNALQNKLRMREEQSSMFACFQYR